MRQRVEILLVIVAATGLITGLVAPAAADAAWALTTGLGIVPAAYWVVRGVLAHQAAVDLIALLALVGTLATGEYFAGAVITLMLGTGRVLESRARARADRDLRSLLARAPRSAHVVDSEGSVTLTALEDVLPGSMIVVLPGEVVPLDGRVVDDPAVLDESALTGEPLPVTRDIGAEVSSGVVNAGSPLRLTTTATAAESTYAGIISMVRIAAADNADSVRIAARFALWFIPLTLALATAAWAISGEAARGVAVLVIATPCPLLLAVPIAIVGGLSAAARRGIVVKGGGALEQLARVRTVLLDKTGTVTVGQPAVERVAARTMPAEELLRLAASIEQTSPHAIASAIIEHAQQAGVALTAARHTGESPGIGLLGEVDGHRVAVGQDTWVLQHADRGWDEQWRAALRAELRDSSSIAAWVVVDGELAGAIVLADRIRSDARASLLALRAAGVDHISIVSGDQQRAAQRVGRALGADEVIAECTPGRKVEVVAMARDRGPCAMVGDGINDAPALATATVGIALGARGATAASEAADIVITVDSFDRVVEAVQVARRTRRIAVQSAALGMGLAGLGMAAAVLGLLPASIGAITQEVIDLVAIASALRALLPARR